MGARLTIDGCRVDHAVDGCRRLSRTMSKHCQGHCRVDVKDIHVGLNMSMDSCRVSSVEPGLRVCLCDGGETVVYPSFTC